MQAKIRCFSLVFSVACASCVQAATPKAQFGFERVDEAAWPLALQQQLVAIHHVDSRVRKAASPVCIQRRGDSGALLDSLSSYPAKVRSAVEQATGLDAFPKVIAIMPGSPAELSGLRAGDRIRSVDNQLFSAVTDTASETDWTIVAQEKLDGRGDGETISVRVDRGGEEFTIKLVPQSTCSGYTALKLDSGHEAFSDRKNVAVTSGLVELAGSEDELAFVIAHELAHTIYQDSDRNGVSRRTKERRADLFATHFIRCAGFEADAGPELMLRLEKNDWQSWLRSPSHPSYKKRVANMQALARDLPCDDSDVLELLTQNARS